VNRESRFSIFRKDEQPVHGHHALALGLDDEGIDLRFRHLRLEVSELGEGSDRPRQRRGIAARQPAVAADYGEPLHFLDHVCRLLHHFGWSWQKPARRARERDEAAIQRWVKQAWPRIKKTPKT